MPGLSGALLGRLKIQFWGACAIPVCSRDPRAGQGASARGSPPAGRGAPRWAPEPGVHHPSPTVLSGSPTVGLSSAPTPGEAPKGHGFVPAQHRAWGRLPANLGDSMGAAGAPRALLFPPRPRSCDPNSSGATWGAFHICHPVPGLQIRFLFPSQGSAELPWLVGVWSQLPLSPPELAPAGGPREPPTSLGPTHGAVSPGRGLPAWCRRLPVFPRL